MERCIRPPLSSLRRYGAALLLALSGLYALSCRADAPGGFLEADSSGAVRPIPTPSQIQSFLPARGPFTFPAPYNTRGVRITTDADCGGNDCVDYIGYSYWRNMNDHVGSNTMLIFVTLDRNRGGGGPTLFSYDKSTDQVTKVGPLFPSSSPFAQDTGEGWYFSASMPTKLYLNDGPRMLRYDVTAKTFQTVFDASSQYGSDTRIWQMHSSDDDNMHSATLVKASTGDYQGCVVYDEKQSQFSFFPKTGSFDECQIDASGRWLVIKEKTPQTCSGCDEDNVIVDLQTGLQSTLLDQNGAGGHSDLGYGYMVAADNWAKQPNVWRLWKLGLNLVQGLAMGLDNLLQGAQLYHGASWGSFAPEHVSFQNARADTPIDQQYACGSGANATNGPRANEVICFLLANTGSHLVVAPVMTDMNAPGGGNDYAKDPKGNLDVTGQYFIWTTNLGGNRLDAVLVKVPSQLFTNGTPVTPPTPTPPGSSPAVDITSPTNGAVVSGAITVSATASSPSGIANVTFELDGGRREVSVNQPPYSVPWDTRSTPAGAHVITAIAVDNTGASAMSPPVSINVLSNVPTNSGGGGGTPLAHRASGGGGGGAGAPEFGMLIALLWLRQRGYIPRRLSRGHIRVRAGPE